MKIVKILTASFPAYSHLVGSTLTVFDFNNQYCTGSQLLQKNCFLIAPKDVEIIQEIC